MDDLLEIIQVLDPLCLEDLGVVLDLLETGEILPVALQACADELLQPSILLLFVFFSFSMVGTGCLRIFSNSALIFLGISALLRIAQLFLVMIRASRQSDDVLQSPNLMRLPRRRTYLNFWNQYCMYLCVLLHICV